MNSKIDFNDIHKKISDKNLSNELNEKNNSNYNKEKSIIRNIIKLGSSYAITFPKDMIIDLANTDREEFIKSMKVYVYKLDENSILIRNNQVESEKQYLKIKINKLTLQLLEEILICSRKLNIQKLEIIYDENNYEECLKIINKYGSPASYTSNSIIIDLSKEYQAIYFKDQINGIIKNIFKIFEFIINPSNKKLEEIQNLINIYLDSIEINFQEALRMLIFKLKYYYIIKTEEEIKNKDASNIINILGDRIIISILKNIAYGASSLIYVKDTSEIEKYLFIIKELPEIITEGINFIFNRNLKSILSDIYNYKLKIDDLKNKYNNIVPKDLNKFSLYEKIITSMIDFVFNNLIEIFKIILTRWVENNIEII